MSFVKNDNGTLIENYTLRMLRDETGGSWPDDTFTNPEYLETLASFNVFPVTDNPPSYDSATHVLQKTGVRLIDGVYEQQYERIAIPSMLSGGHRHPTSSELDANKTLGRAYYKRQIQQHLDHQAGLFEFGESVWDERARTWSFKGSIYNVSAYANAENPWQFVASTLEQWRHRVWATAQTLENSWMHPTRPTPALTWDQLLAQLPTHGLTPPE